MIVLDASVAIALLSATDAHHDRAVSLVTEHADGGFEMHALTLAEVLVGGVRAGRANQMFADLHAVGIEQATSAPDEPLILAELRATTGLRMPDCCVLVVALRESVPIVTFDDRLAREATALGLRVLR